MNARLRKKFVFPAAIVIRDQLYLNQYTVTIDFVTVSENSYEHNVAYERLHYWIDNVLTNSILIHSESDHVKSFKATIAQVIELPDEPVDQIVNLMLFTKLNAILEDRVQITDIELSSEFGDHVVCLHCEEETTFIEMPAWWNDSRPNFGNSKHDRSNKVVSLDRAHELKWKDLGLDWDQEEDEHSVIVAFSKNDSE